MKISAKKYAISLYQILDETPAEKHKTLIREFLRILQKNNQTSLLSKIEEQFEKYHLDCQGVVKVKAISAFPVSHRESLRTKIEKALGQKVILETGEDKELLGGLVIKYQDYLIDGSLKTQLKTMKKKLTNK